MCDVSTLQSSRLRSLLAIVVWGTLVTALPGCRSMIRQQSGVPLEPRAKPVLPYQISQAELLEHLNQNADKTRSWISRSCQIAVTIPQRPTVRLNGTIACEVPRNFRLIADAGMGLISTDVGSNDEYCWFHMQPDRENNLYRVRHDEFDYVRNHPHAQQQMSMPFEPKWLMEVLGVTRIASDGMTMHRDTHPERVNLVSQHDTKDGRMFRRITIVDLHGGNVIGHRIVDSGNNTVVRAELSDFQYEGGAKLPGHIAIDWPAMKMSMAITIRNLTTNSQLQPNLWQPTISRGMNVVDVREQLQRTEQSGHQFRPQVYRSGERPSDRPVYDGNVQTAGMQEEDIPWDDEPAQKKKWFRWPFGKR